MSVVSDWFGFTDDIHVDYIKKTKIWSAIEVHLNILTSNQLPPLKLTNELLLKIKAIRSWSHRLLVTSLSPWSPPIRRDVSGSTRGRLCRHGRTAHHFPNMQQFPHLYKGDSISDSKAKRDSGEKKYFNL